MKMKLAVLMVGLLACGCANQYFVGPSGPNAVPLANGPMTLVNNTPTRLNITIDSVLVFTNIAPGQTVPIHGSAWVPRTPVVVTGYDEKGRYVGASDWIFYNGQAQVWRVESLTKPTY
jgi:hypothetical protein